MTETYKKMAPHLLLLAAVTILAYCNSFGHQFVWDDHDIIANNPLLRSFAAIPRILLSEDRFAEAASGYYRPVPYLWFLFLRVVSGTSPIAFNIANILLHLAVACSFYFLVRKLFRSENMALAAALLLALHPVANESVNFHAGGGNTLLSALFGLLAYLCYLDRKQVRSLLFFALAIFSKEFALLLPFLFAINDLLLKRERRRWVSYVPYLIVIACYLTARSVAVEKANLIKAANPLLQSLANIPQIVATYLFNAIAPANLKVLYEIQFATASRLIGVAVVIALALLLLLFRSRRELLVGGVWFLLFLLPVLNLFPLGIAVVADRYSYFSVMGFAIAAGYLISRCNARAFVPVLAAVCAVYFGVDIKRNFVWANDEVYYREMIADAPSLVHGYQNLGMLYYKKGDLAGAEKYLSVAAGKSNVGSKTLTALAGIYHETGRETRALELLLAALEQEGDNPQLLIMISNLYGGLGKADLARQYHDRAQAVFPGIDEMLVKRATGLCRNGENLMGEKRMAEAAIRFREALATKPDFVPALIDMGTISAEAGDPAKAIGYFAKAAQLEPSNPASQYNLAMAYEMAGRKAEAKGAMQRYNSLQGR